MKNKKAKWPTWDIPKVEAEITLAKLLIPHIKILSRDIVKLIVEDNNKRLKKWTRDFNRLGIRADVYLWKDSPVAFPGIRRHSGRKEISQFSSDTELAFSKDALYYEDNSFPKELWSFALRNCKYDKKGPTNFSLAHIIDHKDYNSKNNEELIGFDKSTEKNLFAGLYTSCTNTIWVPNSLLKPTDYRGNLRKLLIRIIDKYYGQICTLLPHKLSLNLENNDIRWDLKKFPSPIEVGDASYIQNFLTHRNNVIEEKIEIYGKRQLIKN